jgi:hypothetical protein
MLASRLICMSLFTAVAACALKAQDTSLSKERLTSILTSAQIQLPWQIDQDRITAGDEFDWFLHVYEVPIRAGVNACASRLHNLGIKSRQHGPEIAYRDLVWCPTTTRHIIQPKPQLP